MMPIGQCEKKLSSEKKLSGRTFSVLVFLIRLLLRAPLIIQIYRPGLGTSLMLKSTFSPADEILDWIGKHVLKIHGKNLTQPILQKMIN